MISAVHEIVDPTAALSVVLRDALITAGSGKAIPGAAIAPGIRWRPHVYDKTENRAWHCLPETFDPDDDGWMDRMARAVAARSKLKVGICAPRALLNDSRLIEFADRLEAAICLVDEDEPATFRSPTLYASASDFVYMERVLLDPGTAQTILDRNLIRALKAPTTTLKGVRLEVVTATMLSQVAGYEVVSRDVSNRTQQMDVVVHNRNASGILGGGELVVAEAKNWKNPVGTTEYFSLLRKIETRHGRCRLGVFVTTDRFTSGVSIEARSESRTPYMVISLDGESLPRVWRSPKGITYEFEQAAIRASLDQDS